MSEACGIYCEKKVWLAVPLETVDQQQIIPFDGATTSLGRKLNDSIQEWNTVVLHHRPSNLLDKHGITVCVETHSNS